VTNKRTVRIIITSVLLLLLLFCYAQAQGSKIMQAKAPFTLATIVAENSD